MEKIERPTLPELLFEERAIGYILRDVELGETNKDTFVAAMKKQKMRTMLFWNLLHDLIIESEALHWAFDNHCEIERVAGDLWAVDWRPTDGEYYVGNGNTLREAINEVQEKRREVKEELDADDVD